ncbi:MAG: glycosyltransferase [Desulfovibrionaceae bacterium]
MPDQHACPPMRYRIHDSMGRLQTLSSGAEAFALCPASPPAPQRLLVLGLGPATADTGAYIEDIPTHYTDILWTECPAFTAALPPAHGSLSDKAQALPAHWRQVNLAEALHEAEHCDIRLYRQNLRLFPEFWGPVWGKIQQQRLRLPLWPTAAPSVVVLSDSQGLLTRELTQAFSEAGFQSVPMPVEQHTTLGQWQALLREQRPALVFSVNGQGLDPEGELFHLLQACKVPVALWFVDNPWHILTRFRLPWWRGAQLFCTDASFVQPLRAVGAEHVAHLALAAAPHMWEALPYASPQDTDIPHGSLKKLLFVGRLAFPQRQAFFGATRIAPEILTQALSLLTPGAIPPCMPHFGWWTKHLGLRPQDLWPGNAVRAAGLGAEECALRWRLLWLEAASLCGLSYYGQPAPHTQAPPSPHTAPLSPPRPPVDYYSTLPRLYATAPYTLNVTSLLLPHGLTQRHFDVWAAGGFLLSDNTPGLDIFPPELTAEIRLARPQDLPHQLQRLDADPALRQQLQEAWQQHIRLHHRYASRISSICARMRITC